MRKALPVIFFLIFLSFQSSSQLLSWTPDFPLESSDPVTIIVDVSKGNHGLLNYSSTSDVYVHTGVITNLSTSNTSWRYVKFNQNFNQPNPALHALSIESLSQDNATLIVTDLSGRQLLKQNKILAAGNNLVEISEAGKFAKGTYLLTIIESHQIQTIKIIKGN